MNIQTTDAKGLYTKKLIAAYKEKTVVQDFLGSFFPTKATDITDTLEVSIEVQRNTEKIAVDVVRGSDGNRNEFTRSSEKIFIPPYFREYFDQTNMSVYETAFRQTEISGNMFSRMINDMADHAMELQYKIERTYNIYRSQILETGIVTFTQGVGQIDFLRKASSKVNLNGAGGYWVSNNNLFAQFQAGGDWLRKNGKVMGHRFTAILGSTAITDMYANTSFLARQNLFNMKLDSIAAPIKNSSGGVYHGTLTAGPYQVDIYSYPDFYEDASGVMQPYINPKIAIMLPSEPMFKTVYGAVPQLLNPGEAPRTGKFILSEYTDEKRRTREFHVESAGVPIPVAIDLIYTMQAVA